MKATSATTQRQGIPRTRVAAYIAVLLVGIAVWWWFQKPGIPQVAFEGTDPEVALALHDAELRVLSDARSADAWGDFGLLLLAHGYREEALTCFDKASELGAADWRWPYAAAYALAAEDPRQAIEHLDQSLARAPKEMAPQLWRAELLASLGEVALAQGQFEDVLKERPTNARANLGLARLRLLKNELQTAETAAHIAAKSPLARQAATMLLAQIYARQGKVAEAEAAEALGRTLPSDPPWKEPAFIEQLSDLRVGRVARLQRVAALEASGATPQAQTEAQAVQEKHQAVYHFAEGRGLFEAGDYTAAERAFRRAVADDGTVETQYWLGKSLAAQAKWTEAEAALRGALATEPSYGPAYLLLGRCLETRDAQAAMQAYQAAVQYMPRSAEARRALETFQQRSSQ